MVSGHGRSERSAGCSCPYQPRLEHQQPTEPPADGLSWRCVWPARHAFAVQAQLVDNLVSDTVAGKGTCPPTRIALCHLIVSVHAGAARQAGAAAGALSRPGFVDAQRTSTVITALSGSPARPGMSIMPAAFVSWLHALPAITNHLDHRCTGVQMPDMPAY